MWRQEDQLEGIKCMALVKDNRKFHKILLYTNLNGRGIKLTLELVLYNINEMSKIVDGRGHWETRGPKSQMRHSQSFLGSQHDNIVVYFFLFFYLSYFWSLRGLVICERELRTNNVHPWFLWSCFVGVLALIFKFVKLKTHDISRLNWHSRPRVM